MEKKYSYKFTVLSSQRDSLLRLRLDATLKLFQDIATIHAQKMGIAARELMEKDNAYWVVSRTKVHFDEMPMESDELEATTWPMPTKGVRCDRSYTVSKNGKVVISGVSEWVMIDAATRRLRKVETTHYPTDIEWLTETAIDEPFMKFDKVFLEDDFVYETKIRSTDIDVTRHANNAVYCNLILNVFTFTEQEKSYIIDFEIAYHREALEGDVLRIYRKNTVDGDFFEIRKVDGTVVATAFLKFAYRN